MRRGVLVAAAVLAFLNPPSPLACSCVTGSAEGTIRHAPIIVAVRVTDVEYVRSPKIGYSRWLHYGVVLATWRGYNFDSVVLVASGSNCDARFDAGHTYLVYAGEAKGDTLWPSACSRTGALSARYFDQYLLGRAPIVHDSTMTEVTLDTILDLFTRNSAAINRVVDEFSLLRPEANLLLPKLLRIARGDTPGNRTAAMRAIGQLGDSARDVLNELRRFDFPGGDATFRAAKLETLMRVSGDFADLKWEIARGLKDPSPEVRVVVLERTPWLRDPMESRWEIKKLVAVHLDDPDWRVRYATIGLFAWWEYSPDIVRKIKRMSRSDPDMTVRDRAEWYLEMKEDRSRRAPIYRSVSARGLGPPAHRKQRK